MEGSLSTIKPADLISVLSGNPEALEAHLTLVERDFAVAGHAIKVHCHCLAVDGNGQVQPARLAEFMRRAIADFAIPKSKIAEAKARDIQFNSTEAVAALFDRARKSFTDLKKSGEGGELLLFLLAERFLKLPQIMCKMDLKTDSQMHYHGADGIYAGVTDEGVLKLYWGESKIYKDAADAIRDCFNSLTPFLVEPEGEDAERERDLILLSDKADLSNPKLTEALRRYFDLSSPQSKKVEYCGVALIGFDVEFYPTVGTKGLQDEVANAARTQLAAWAQKIEKQLTTNKLAQIEIELLCVPLPSAEAFRAEFFKALGLEKE